MKKIDDIRSASRPISPGSKQQRADSIKSLNLKTSPMPMLRTLSGTRRDITKTGKSEKDDNSGYSHSHVHTHNPGFSLDSPSPSLMDKDKDRDKFQVPSLQAPAPLNEAAAAVVSLVNTAVPSLARAFSRKGKGRDSYSQSEEEVEPRAGCESVLPPFPHAASVDQVSAITPRHRNSNSVGNLQSVGTADDAVCEVVMGVVSKWINIGRGWGPRLFVLEGGVLSYYKLDGPDKVSVRLQVQGHKNVRFLGEDIKRLIQKEKEKESEKGSRPSSFTAQCQKPLGTVHVLVSNTRPSKSDDKKFYIYSGTKTLDIRADTPEERDQWIETLGAAKLRIDESMRELDELEESRCAALVTVREDAISRLMTQLKEGGLPNEGLAKFEESLRSEVLGGLQKRLKEEQHQKHQLQRRVNELEMEKLQLETAVVEESRESREQASSRMLQPIEDGAECDSREGSEEGDGGLRLGHTGEEEEEEGEDNFFEALTDFMESSSGRIESQRMDMPVNMEKVGFDYPAVRRRTRLPEAVEKEKAVSLWAIIKDCVGKDVSRITLPVFFNEPISTLQKCAEEMEYTWLLDRAAVYGSQGNQLMRALHVAAFAVSGYACTEGRPQKPFNPMLGETFEAEYPDKGWKLIAEKMQHNPNVVASHCEGRGWVMWGDCNMRIRFWGPSMQLDPLGVLSVRFEDGEVYEWSKVTTGIYNLILGKLYIDHYGTMTISSNRNGMTVKLKFKERSMFDRNVHQVQGYAQDASGEKLATLIGKWSEHLHFVLGDAAVGDEKELLSNAQLLWQASPRSEHCGKYKFTPFCVTLNEMTPGLKEHLPPSDSRLRPDQRLLELGMYEKANEEKLRLENKQREARKSGEEGWHGRYFEQAGPHNTWTYNGKYWNKRAKHEWSNVKDYFAGGNVNVDDLLKQAEDAVKGGPLTRK